MWKAIFDGRSNSSLSQLNVSMFTCSTSYHVTAQKCDWVWSMRVSQEECSQFLLRHVLMAKGISTWIPIYYAEVGIFILRCLVLSTRIYLFSTALSYYVSLVKTKGNCTLIFVGLMAVVIGTGDFIVPSSEQCSASGKFE